jgi:hypothetical protein
MHDWPSRSSVDVPSPRPVAAWLAVDTLPTERIPYFAAHWLVQGYDGPHVIALAGMSGDDPHDVRDVLDDALADCGIPRRSTTAAAAMVDFTGIGRMGADGLAGERWVVDKVVEVIANSDYSSDVTDLPLRSPWGLDDEWGAGWGRTQEQLAARVREACSEQLTIADSGPASRWSSPVDNAIVEIEPGRS